MFFYVPLWYFPWVTINMAELDMSVVLHFKHSVPFTTVGICGTRRAGVRAEHARRLFEEAGYKDARNFSGSMLEWNAKHKLPVPPTC